MIIKIERYFAYPNLKRQTSGHTMKWGEFTFTEENIDECDYLIILDYPKESNCSGLIKTDNYSNLSFQKNTSFSFSI